MNVLPVFASQIILFVDNLPGGLIYQQVLLFAFGLTATIALLQWRIEGAEARLFWAAAGLFGVHFTLLTVTALADEALVPSLAAAIPPLDRAVSALTIVLIIWAFAFPKPARLADAVTVGLARLTIIALVVSWWLWGQGPVTGAAPMYNGSAQESVWEIAQLVLLLAGGLLLAARRNAEWHIGLGVVALLFFVHALQLVLPISGDVPGLVRLVEIVTLPLFTVLVFRRSSMPLAQAVAGSGAGTGPTVPGMALFRTIGATLPSVQRGRAAVYWPSTANAPARLAERLNISRDWLIALGYLAGITVAEALIAFQAPQVGVGLGLDGALLVGMLLHASVEEGRRQKLLLALALAPLIRVVSLSMPLATFKYIYWFAIVGVPLFAAAILTARLTGMRRVDVGLAVHGLHWQILVGLSGLAFGYVEYLILRPAPLISDLTWAQFWLPALILAVFTGLLEEVIYRGLLQHAAVEILGRWGVVYVAVLFAVLHLGYRSALDMTFVFAVGLFFGLVVNRTRSIIGVSLAHSLINISLYLIFPMLLGR